MSDLVADYVSRHPRCDPELAAATLAELSRLIAMGIPMGGPPIGQVNNGVVAYPLICVCAVPVPEWVYVANQCATCKRLIRETTP